MKLRMCGCWMCKAGRKSKFGRYLIKHQRSAARSETRRLLRKGEYDMLPQAVAVGYTD